MNPRRLFFALTLAALGCSSSPPAPRLCKDCAAIRAAQVAMETGKGSYSQYRELVDAQNYKQRMIAKGKQMIGEPIVDPHGDPFCDCECHRTNPLEPR